jgi:uncharacterized membrane protein
MSSALAAVPRVSEEWQLTAVGGFAELVIALFAALAVAAVVWTWLALDPKMPLRARVGITALRAAALTLAVVFLLQPTLRLLRMQPVPPRIAVLIDVSDSMGRGGEHSRLKEVSRLLEGAAPALKRLAGAREVSWFAFAEQLSPATSWRSAVDKPSGTHGTDLRRALEQLAAHNRIEPLGAVLVIGDGADTSASRASANGSRDAAFARELGIPINTVAITRSRRQRDLAVSRVKADSFAFARSDTPISVSLSSFGIDEKRVDVSLSQGGSLIQQRAVDLVGGAAETTFLVKPMRLGLNVFTVTTAIPPGDEIPENNTAHVAFEVMRDKVRVLHVAGRPSWDQRFLRDALSARPQIDLVSFYVLRTPFQSTSLGSDGLTLIPFPTAELFENHLDEFDVLIFQDLGIADVGLDRYLEGIARFVKTGGGLVLLGAETGFAPSAMSRPPFSEILPIVMPDVTGAPAVAEATPLRVALTEAGKRHPMTRLVNDEAQNAALWDSLERLDGMIRVPGVTEDGVVLAVPSGERAEGPSAPLVSVREVGEGRTVAITTDSTWRWRFCGPLLGGAAEAYPNLWRNVIDWVTRDPRLNRLKVDVSPPSPQPDEPVTITVELVDASFQPVPHASLNAEIRWADASGVARSAPLPFNLDGEGRYRKVWRPRESGPHAIRVTARGVAPAEAKFLVASRNVELQQVEPDAAFLRAVAEQSGGRYDADAIDFGALSLADVPTRKLLTRRDSPLWNHPVAYLLLVGALLAEWFVRRRKGLN